MKDWSESLIFFIGLMVVAIMLILAVMVYNCVLVVNDHGPGMLDRLERIEKAVEAIQAKVEIARLELDEDRRTPLNRAIAAMMAENNRLKAEAIVEAVETAIGVNT